MLSRVTSGRTPTLLIRLECIVRKLRKSTVAGKPSFLTVGLRCRRSKLRRFTGPPFALVKTRSSGFRYLDLCQVASRTARKIPRESNGMLCRAPVDCAPTAPCQVLRHMGRHSQMSTLGHEIPSVEALISVHGHRLPSRNLLQHH